jgi:lysophospholipid acyltransferase (LPLAT)-like uncharacterized protein
MSRRWKYPWWVGPVGVVTPNLVRALGSTWKIEQRGDDPSRGPLERGGRCIFAFWHACLPPLVYTHRGRGGAVISSRHLDGELTARALGGLGYVTARGSSTRAGEEALRRVVGLAETSRFVAITPDGPHGPAYVAKRGAIFVASTSGLPLIPVATASSASYVLRSWDRMRVPKPFARVVVRFGEPLRIPRELDDAEFERWRVRLETELTALTRATKAEIGEPA